MVEKITNIDLEIISLYRYNYLARFHVREIAKLISKSHVTLLPHLKAMEKSRILDFEMVGKNKRYFLNIDNIITKNLLICGEMFVTNNLLKKMFMLQSLAEELGKISILNSFILFGSYSDNSFDENSDLDILSIENNNKTEIKAVKKLEPILGKKIDYKVVKTENFFEGLRKNDALLVEVVKKHVILQNPGLFVNGLWRLYGERQKFS